MIPLRQSLTFSMVTLRRLKTLQFRLARKFLFFWIKPTFINNDRESLALNESDIVCYVLPFRSSADLHVANQACRNNELAELVNPIAHFDESRSFFFLGHPEGRLGRKTMRHQSDRMVRLFYRQQEFIIQETQALSTEETNSRHRLKIVPISIFWGHQPDREKSLLKLILSENWSTTSRFKKFLAMVFHPKHILVKFGKPIDLSEIIQSNGERSRQIKKLLRITRVHFNQERQAIIGPDLSHRRTLIDTILRKDGVQQAISKEAKISVVALSKVKEKARGYAEEIVSDQSYRVIRFFDALLTWLWNRLYNGIEINGIEQVRQIAQSHELVYTPCHRSHIDYLLLSYVLYHNGLTPPHIAAGRNLNLPIIGIMLRRAGAFYMRRSFQGDALYREVFDEYLHQMFTRGFSLEYFIEGGRSRTGRTLPPKTGMLSMTVRSFLRNSDNPIALLPVYFGYERVLESSSYQSELSGNLKTTESFFDIFRIFSFFKHDFGQVTVNFGKPLLLKEFLDETSPKWYGEEKPEITAISTRLAQELVTRINSAAAIKSTNLVALTMLSTERQSITERDLKRQVSLLRDIASKSRFAAYTIVDKPTDELIEEAIRIMGLTRVEHAFGAVVAARTDQTIAMAYNANNITHIYALPSLVCRYIRSQKEANPHQLKKYIKDIYPYFRSEMYLPWPDDELEQMIDETINCLTGHHILQRENKICAPASETYEYSCLTQLANITAATIERFYVVIALLKARSNLSQRELESSAAGIAAQLSTLYGIDPTDFFEKPLFSIFVDTLKKRGSSIHYVAEKLEPIVKMTISPDIRNKILQAVSRDQTNQVAIY